MRNRFLTIALLSLITSSAAQAALIARGTDMVYDDVNNITWASDANLFKTQAASNPNLVSEIIVANGGVINDTPNYFDTVPNSGVYSLSSADFVTSSGTMSWWGAQAWANNLSLGGYTDWSLPTTAFQIAGYNQTNSQLGDLFYNQLSGVAGTSITTAHNDNYNLFSNVQSYIYWSSTEYASVPLSAWHFVTYDGGQFGNGKFLQLYAWAVRPGDVSVAAVPLPGAVWLFLSGLGLVSFKRKLKKI